MIKNLWPSAPENGLMPRIISALSTPVSLLLIMTVSCHERDMNQNCRNISLEKTRINSKENLRKNKQKFIKVQQNKPTNERIKQKTTNNPRLKLLDKTNGQRLFCRKLFDLTHRSKDFPFVVYCQIFFSLQSPDGDEVRSNREKLQNR